MCDLNGPDGYGVEFQNAERVARKRHVCGECSREILPGQRYGYFFGQWEGDTFQHRWCPRCLKARKWLNARGHTGWTVGELLSDVRYCAETDGAEIIAEAKARRGGAS